MAWITSSELMTRRTLFWNVDCTENNAFRASSKRVSLKIKSKSHNNSLTLNDRFTMRRVFQLGFELHKDNNFRVTFKLVDGDFAYIRMSMSVTNVDEDKQIESTLCRSHGDFEFQKNGKDILGINHMTVEKLHIVRICFLVMLYSVPIGMITDNVIITGNDNCEQTVVIEKYLVRKFIRNEDFLYKCLHEKRVRIPFHIRAISNVVNIINGCYEDTNGNESKIWLPEMIKVCKFFEMIGILDSLEDLKKNSKISILTVFPENEKVWL